MDQDVTWYRGRPRPRRLCVRWGPRSPSPKGGGAQPLPQIFGPCLMRPNGWMNEAGTWHGGRPQPRRLCVRWGPSPLPQKGAETPSPISSPFLLWPNGCMHQNATWYGARPWPRRLCVRWGSRSPLPQRGIAPFQFSAHICCGQMAAWIKMSLGMEVGLGPGDFVLDGDPASPPQKGPRSRLPPKFSAHV